MSDLLQKLETHYVLDEATPGFFLSRDDFAEIIAALKNRATAMPNANDLAEVLIFIGLISKNRRDTAIEKAEIILKLCKNSKINL